MHSGDETTRSPERGGQVQVYSILLHHHPEMKDKGQIKGCRCLCECVCVRMGEVEEEWIEK